MFGAEVFDAVLDFVLDVLCGRGNGLTDVVALVFSLVHVDRAGFIGAGAGIGGSIVRC